MMISTVRDIPTSNRSVVADISRASPTHMRARYSWKIAVFAATFVILTAGISLGAYNYRIGVMDYQAVFLDNGQVYFGKVKHPKRTYVIVTDVYYFGPSQPSREAMAGAASSDIALVKLGSELHGPTDEIKILRDHILFIEELAPESRVVEAIREYKDKN